MEEVGEIVKNILGLTPEYGNFVVIAFLIIVVLVIVFFTTKDIMTKRILLIIFSIMGLYAFYLFAIDFRKDKEIGNKITPEQLINDKTLDKKVKTLSIEESVQKYIDDFNNGYYGKSFEFVKNALLNRDGFADKEGYINYWKNQESTYSLQNIDKNNSSFHVLIKLKKYNLVRNYKLYKKNNKWLIEKKIFDTKIKNGKIKYEGVDSKKIEYEATFNNNGSIIKSFSRKIALGKDCDVNLYNLIENQNKWHQVDSGRWYQNDNGFFIIFNNHDKISFYNQEVMLFNHNCWSK